MSIMHHYHYHSLPLPFITIYIQYHSFTVCFLYMKPSSEEALVIWSFRSRPKQCVQKTISQQASITMRMKALFSTESSIIMIKCHLEYILAFVMKSLYFPPEWLSKQLTTFSQELFVSSSKVGTNLGSARSKHK